MGEEGILLALIINHRSPCPVTHAGRGAMPCAIVLFCFVCCIALALFLVPKVLWADLALIKALQPSRWMFTFRNSETLNKSFKGKSLALKSPN